jgi:hypothetical protein
MKRAPTVELRVAHFRYEGGGLLQLGVEDIVEHRMTAGCWTISLIADCGGKW